MKKNFILILITILMPISIHAAEYDIEHFYIDAYLKENGDMDISELIVLDGTFNGYERDLIYEGEYSNYNASNIENLSIYAKHVSDVSFATFNSDFDTFESVEYATLGDFDKYILSSLSGGLRVRMYYKTESDKTAFLIKYTLKDVGISHEDVVEYYWNFIGSDFEDEIKDLQIRVNYLSKMNIEDFSWWFHGPLTGSSDIVNVSDNYTSILAKIKKVDAYTSVDFRTILPKQVFNESLFSKKDNLEVKESIIKSEDAIVKKDNELRKKNKIIFYTVEIASISYYILLILIWVYVYKKYDKERKPKFINTYNREFIDDYNVEVIDYLMNKNITPNAMSASLMNLIYKKNITAEKIPDSKNDYEFTLINRDNLNDTENYLVDFLFNTVGTNNKFTSKNLKAYASSTKTCNTFMNSYTKWKEKVIEDGKNANFYDNLPGKFGYGFLMLFLAFIIFFIKVIFNVDSILPGTLIFAAAVFFIYLGTIKRKSEKGIEHYAKWKAFKKFLEDFGAFDIKELPEIILWERYLVYATIFGLAKKVQKSMNVKINEINASDMYYTNNYIFISDYDFTSTISSSISGAVSEAQSTINREIANSSSGSFGGHGGGFSSGGGFGGGGGGGRGF